MKISKGDIIITDFPGFRSLTVKQDEVFSDGQSFLLEAEDGTGEMWRFTREELTDVVTAFRTALAVNVTEDITSAPKPTPGTFHEGDACPKDLIKVIDKDVRIWTRAGDSEWTAPDILGLKFWDSLVTRYGPLQRVKP